MLTFFQIVGVCSLFILFGLAIGRVFHTARVMRKGEESEDV